MMFQDQNGNYQYGLSIIATGRHLSSRLPAIHEDKYLHNVPDINLECDETINWDELEPCIYNERRNGKVHMYEEETMDTDNSEFYHDYPPPNSPVKGLENDQPLLLLQNNYVNSLLQIWRDSQRCDSLACNDNEDDDDTSLPSEEQQSSQETVTSSEDLSDDHDERDASFDGVVNEGNIVPSVSAEMEQWHDLPLSQSSSRSPSPTEMEMMLQFRQNIRNFRSISPIIVRSPSPLDSRSSSPRFLRSPSPLDFLEHSMSYDSSNELVFYEDRYILRSISPVSGGSVDHQVPDVNIDFQQAVSNSEEFPSYRSYRAGRIQNSCEDQVVPEFIEE